MNMEELKPQLEMLIDKNSMGTVLNALSQIAYEKELHIKENWQDTKTASNWRRAGRLIDSITYYINC